MSLAEIPSAAQIPLSMLVVFASAKLMAEVLERLRQPSIVGEILAGVLIGPTCSAGSRPTRCWASSRTSASCSCSSAWAWRCARRSSRVGGIALLVAACGVVVPFATGWGICALWGQPRIESIFTAAAMVATSVGITAQVLASQGLLEERASRIVMAAAVADDVLGLIVLAIVSGMARGPLNHLDIALTAAIAAGFTVFTARFGTRTAQRIIPGMRARLNVAEGEFALAMTLLFALSLLAVYAGVAAIVGAFLAGMALSETVERRVRDLTAGVSELLVPFFLAGVGLNLDLSAFSSGRTLSLAAAILVAAVLSKFIGCGLGALKMGRADAIRVGVGMIPRGEVGMVVAQIGLRMKVMGQGVYGVVVFMSVATTLIAPPLLRLAFRGTGHGAPQGRDTTIIGT